MSKVQAAKRKSGLIKQRGKKVRAAPGTLQHVGDISKPLTRIHYLRYDQSAVHEQEIADVQPCAPRAKAQQTGWKNTAGLHNPDVIRSHGERSLTQPSVSEDIVDTNLRATIEVHDDSLFIDIKALTLSETSQRLKKTLKTLTLFASIFVPLTFIAGVYGMNFDYMPELHWRWGYPLIMLVMAGCGAGLLYYFRRQHWL